MKMFNLKEPIEKYFDELGRFKPKTEAVFTVDNGLTARQIAEIEGKWKELSMSLKMSELKDLIKSMSSPLNVKLCYKNTKKKEFVVIFNDGTREVAKYDKEKDFTPYVGFALCIAKKIFGSNTAFHDVVNGLYKPVETKTERKEEKKDDKR